MKSASSASWRLCALLVGVEQWYSAVTGLGTCAYSVRARSESAQLGHTPSVADRPCVCLSVTASAAEAANSCDVDSARWASAWGCSRAPAWVTAAWMCSLWRTDAPIDEHGARCILGERILPESQVNSASARPTCVPSAALSHDPVRALSLLESIAMEI